MGDESAVQTGLINEFDGYVGLIQDGRQRRMLNIHNMGLICGH